MRVFGSVFGSAITLCLLACSAPSPEATGSPEVITLINQRRADAGCPPVTPEERLATAARRQATDMRDNGVQDHTGSDGSSPQERIEAAGFTPAQATGEILLWGNGPTGPQQMVDAWMASPPHRKVIEQCDFTHAGSAVLQVEDRYYAVVASARPT